MSLGDDEHPISMLFEAEEVGDHVHVTVRSGIKGMRALAGRFTLRRDEWVVLRDNLTYCEPIDDKLGTMVRYAPKGATSLLSGVRLVHFDPSPIEVTETSVRERDEALFGRLDTAAQELRGDYQASRVIDAEQFPFYALVMAAMRRADTDNAQLLRAAFPDTWAELDARYNAPGGLLPGERVRVEHRVDAGPDRLFAPDAFDGSLNDVVPIKMEGAPVGSAILIAATVIEEGKAVLLTLDIDAALGTREIQAIRLP